MKNHSRISAVILASGVSQRMGTAKQLLPFKGVPMLEHVIRKLLHHPFHKIYAIIGPHAKEIKSWIQVEDERFEWKINNRYQDGQSAALKTAARSVGDADGMMVFLGDQPMITGETIKRVIEEAEKRLLNKEVELVVQPSFLGKRGHPVFISNRMFSYFDMLEGDQGGKHVIEKAQHHHIIPVDDPGILFDVDTPEDYWRLLSKTYKKD